METFLTHLLLVLAIIGVSFTQRPYSLTYTEQGPFPCGYKFFSDAEGWFKLKTDATTWSQANWVCELEGAQLASPATDAIKAAMVSVLTADNEEYSNVYTPGYSPNKWTIIHTAMHPTDPEVTNEVELQLYALGLTSTGELRRVSQYDSFPYICYKKAPEDVDLDECNTVISGYTKDNRTRHCYKFHRGRSSWFVAAQTCATEGGYLAIINSEEEAQVIRDIFAANPENLIPGWAWKDSAFLGFRAKEEMNWVTVYGESLTESGYADWSPGEPNNAGGNEFCGSVGRNGKLFDDPCFRELPFICEKKPKNNCRISRNKKAPETPANDIRNIIEKRASQYMKQ